MLDTRANDLVIRIRGKFLEIDGHLFNPRWIVSVECYSQYYGCPNPVSEYHFAVRIRCMQGKYYYDQHWEFGRESYVSGRDDNNKDIYTNDSQRSLHKVQAAKFFDRICAALELMGSTDG